MKNVFFLIALLLPATVARANTEKPRYPRLDCKENAGDKQEAAIKEGNALLTNPHLKTLRDNKINTLPRENLVKLVNQKHIDACKIRKEFKAIGQRFQAQAPQVTADGCVVFDNMKDSMASFEKAAKGAKDINLKFAKEIGEAGWAVIQQERAQLQPKMPLSPALDNAFFYAWGFKFYKPHKQGTPVTAEEDKNLS
jgi:hypothetical protein